MPDITGYTPQVGTKITRTESNKGGLSCDEVADNVALPWTRSRPVLVAATDTLSRADYDARIIVTEPGVRLTLGGAAYRGLTLSFFAAFEEGFCTLVNGDSEDRLAAGHGTAYVWDGTAYTREGTYAHEAGHAETTVRPLYANPVVVWDGADNLSTATDDDGEFTDSRWADIITVGTATKALYNAWNNRYIITYTQPAAFNQPRVAMPTNFIVLRMKPNNTDRKHKTFFLYFPNADSNAYGNYAAWLCSPGEGHEPLRLIGMNGGDKGTGEGNAVQHSFLNRAAMTFRYYQWIPFNFTLSDDLMDDDGYIYVGITNTIAKTYFAGWAMADRLTDMTFQSAEVENVCFNPRTVAGVPSATSQNFNGLKEYNYARNTAYKEQLFPLNDGVEGRILLGFLCANDQYIPQLVFTGSATGTEYHWQSVDIGNFGRLARQNVNGAWTPIAFRIPAEEVAANTVTIHGQKYLSVDIPAFLSERAFFWNGAWTEPE